MNLPGILETLGYGSSGNFSRSGTAAFDRAPDIGHILRAATGKKSCRLEGVYLLRPFDNESSPVPVVYVCEADDLATADEIHRLVWNQDIVPFLLVRTPAGLRLYSGFVRDESKADGATGLLEPLVEFNQIHDRLAEFHADAIDSGELWRRRGQDVRPDKRVYWSLLENLKQLAKKFRDQFGRDNVKSIIHPLIGKYVYLHYLKDRGFLSPRRLEEWQIECDSVFGHTATLAGLRTICEKLDGFLNGRVFPLKFRGASAPTEEQIQRIAGAFAGDTFEGQWQFHLPFTAFKFAYIPIETLSMIYEQFLHLPDQPDSDEEDEHSEGRKAGAYYTPIPVVNYMLAEMDKRRRLQRGVRVFDPSCGSGAFLVQCYRRLIEREFINQKKKPAPHELATLLKRHIFGVDMDEDACSVAEFSLYLTLLDYVEPSDLIDHPRFRLPTLRKKNIFHSDFFKVQPFKTRFHWVVGNPPWKKLIPHKLEKRDEAALKWMKAHIDAMPVGDNSLLQAFAWRCREFLAADGACGLLLHAMTLFENPSSGFRRAFFAAHRMYAVSNFSNLARDLFAGRAIAPAAAFFFRSRKRGEIPDALEKTVVFSPLLANQETTRPSLLNARNETWSITVNGDEVRELPLCDIATGSGLPWKLATWGSALDASLLGRMRRLWRALDELDAHWSPKSQTITAKKPSQIFFMSEGPQLGRTGGVGQEPVDFLLGAEVADVKPLKGLRRVFSLDGVNLPENEDGFLRIRGGRKGLAVCRPPHVIVSETRNFAVFGDKVRVVPDRQIGIISLSNNRRLLKALALYLSSDFALYHQFFTATHFGVKRPIATLKALRQIPVPILDLSEDELASWESLHDRLATTAPRLVGDLREPDPQLGGNPSPDGQDELVRQLNDLVNAKLGLDDIEQALVHDLVQVRMALDDGNIGRAAMHDAGTDELQTYAEWLQRELDANSDGETRHSVTVLHDARSGFIAIEPAMSTTTARVLAADSAAARTFARTRKQLREEHAQWVYFDRSLRLHRGKKTYLFKPIQRMHWTRSRAMLDAADIEIGGTRDEPLRNHDE